MIAKAGRAWEGQEVWSRLVYNKVPRDLMGVEKLDFGVRQQELVELRKGEGQAVDV